MLSTVIDKLKGFVLDWLLWPLLVQKGPASGRAIALTFDDGPHADFTPQVLDLLRAHGTAATFFLVGVKARAHPELVARIIREGHELANHSMTHPEFDALSLGQIHAEVTKMDRLLRGFGLTQSSIWFRPPKGVLNLRTIWYAAAHRRRYAMWSNDPKDFKATSLRDVEQHFAEQPPSAGDVILLHDKTATTVSLVDVLLRDLSARGLRAVTLSQLLAG
jgi:peptidoglycan/xylan/chitin deacetylase (PgdA/CDA1 family)